MIREQTGEPQAGNYHVQAIGRDHDFLVPLFVKRVTSRGAQPLGVSRAENSSTVRRADAINVLVLTGFASRNKMVERIACLAKERSHG